MALNQDTLFHLVPDNEVAQDALIHADNKRFVSRCCRGADGLEIGYHVPSIPQGHVIARLGRNADLILHQSTISAVHLAFEIDPADHLVRLSVRSKCVSSVSFKLLEPAEDSADEYCYGDGVMPYGRNHLMFIGSYKFRLIWRTIHSDHYTNIKALKALAIQGFQKSEQQLQNVRSRDRPTEYADSNHVSWHDTRLKTANSANFADNIQILGKIGSGSFGTVYKAVDRSSRHVYAVKVIDLTRHGPDMRALIHREIKVMERLKHKNIIDYLGNKDFDTTQPKIYMNLCEGNLTSLAQSVNDNSHQILRLVLEQGLSALDYLASQNLIHRDVKPDNILYRYDRNQLIFQLADFGLARLHTQATSFVGTFHYQAPELLPAESKIFAAQSPKMDIWSLFASIAAVYPDCPNFPPTQHVTYSVILDALKDASSRMPQIEAMARKDPARRASAAQMLVLLFGGKGLTTHRSRIPDIAPAN